MRPALSRRLEGFGTTIFTEMTRLANEHGAINLSQGFPDFDGPEFAKAAAIAAIEAGHGQYARMTGIPEIHRALSAKYRRDWALDFAPDTELVVTSGATEAIFSAIQGVCDAGDEVVLFEPYYDSYKASVAMAGAVPKVVTLHAPDWRFDEGELTEALSPRTRAILVNTPHNPTGKVFSPAELETIAAHCRERDLLCITDEVYEHLVYDGRHVPMASLPGMRERTITISSFGKTFSLTGWKIGWAAGPAELVAAVRSAHQFVTFATATPLQHGAAVALGAPAGVLRGTARGISRAARLSRRGALAHRVRPAAAAGLVLHLRRLSAVRLRRRPRLRPAHDREGRRRGDPAERLLRPPRARASLRALRVLQEDGNARGGGGAAGATVRLALVQMDLAWEDVAENHRRARRHLEDARQGGARLALLPEMFCTGFSMDADRIAQPPGGASEKFLRETARALGLWILGSIPETGPRRPRNTAILAGPDGSLEKYAKIHPFTFGGEDRVYEGGDRIVTVSVEGVRVTPFVCYDLRFPEPFRLAAEETDLFAVVANWPEARREHWRTLLRARAIENLCYVAGVNRVGEGGKLRYAGESVVVSPWGEVLVEGGPEEAVLFADIDPAVVRDARAKFPALTDRRPEAYRR